MTTKRAAAIGLGCLIIFLISCNQAPSTDVRKIMDQSAPDPELTGFIDSIKAVDNHAHPNTINPDDRGSDALPLDPILPIELPARLRMESSDWPEAFNAIYGGDDEKLNDTILKGWISKEEKKMKLEGEKFPAWVLDRSGIEVMLANRISLGPGINSPRFRWVSYVDALLFPLSTKTEASVTPDREKLFPMEDHLLQQYLSDLNMAELPAILDEYLKHVVTSTLEEQQRGGCVAVKFEAAYLRSLDFEKVSRQSAAEVYSQYVHGGLPPHDKYKLLQDFLFRYIALEAGRLGMAVHIHSFSGFGNYYVAADSDPLLLEPVFNDPELRKTNFVIIHGGGPFTNHISAMLWKPNVYADISMLTRVWTKEQLANVLSEWLSLFPEKVIFGTDAGSFGPGLGWELGAWIAAHNARQALTIALSAMIRNNEITRKRSKAIATMVLRTNAGNLYHLGLK